MLIKPLNVPGRHCASSGLRNLSAFHGLGWTEAMCFGMGAGLGIWYIKGKNPSRMIHVRSADLEKQFFIRIGMPLPWDQHEDPQDALAKLISKLDEGLPAIVQTDIYYLPYYQSSTHFPGHVITVWGYDPDKEVFLITDTERPDLIEVAYNDLAQALYFSDAFFSMKGNCMAPSSIPGPDDMGATIREAILFNSRIIMDPAWEIQGIQGLKTCLGELDRWVEFEDSQWVFRFAYQVIEKRGTGGGGFRLMYRDFLEEAQAFLPSVKELGLVELMAKTASAWTALSLAMKDVSEMSQPDLGAARTSLENVIRSEALYHESALTL